MRQHFVPYPVRKLEIRHYFRADLCDRDQIAMTHAAVVIEIRGGFEIEGHSLFEHILRERMNTRTAIRIRSREADPVTGRVPEGFPNP